MAYQPARDRFSLLNFMLFWAVGLSTLIGIPLYAYLCGFSFFDCGLFLVMYIVTGMGITVGYHRLVAHQRFDCRSWVKAGLLVIGGWAFQNSALIWCTDHIRHHAKTQKEEDPYNILSLLGLVSNLQNLDPSVSAD